MTKKNTGLFERTACPECGSTGPFSIRTQPVSDEDGDLTLREIVGSGLCYLLCDECFYEDLVDGFLEDF